MSSHVLEPITLAARVVRAVTCTCAKLASSIFKKHDTGKDDWRLPIDCKKPTKH